MVSVIATENISLIRQPWLCERCAAHNRGCGDRPVRFIVRNMDPSLALGISERSETSFLPDGRDIES
jgi:hypothetical protein